MYAAAGRGRCGAEINILCRSGIVSPRRAEEKVANINDATADIATDQVGIHGFQISGIQYAARQYAVAETRGEPLDLCFDLLQHIHPRAVGHVTVSPDSVLAARSATRIEKGWLHQQNKWTIAVLPVAYSFF